MSNNVGTYEKIGSYLAAAMSERKHGNTQAEFLDEFIKGAGLDNKAKILDGACGSGDTLMSLIEKGYSHVLGMDGSNQMVSLAKRSVKHKIEICEWAQIESYLKRHGPFNVVYFLGHSLPHADRDTLFEVYRAVKAHLAPNGLFLFDMRNWTRNQGNLLENSRPINQWRQIDQVELDGITYQLFDHCSYSGDKQVIGYRVVHNNDVIAEEFLTYTLFSEADVKKWLETVGFTKVKVQRRSNWSYVIVCAYN